MADQDQLKKVGKIIDRNESKHWVVWLIALLVLAIGGAALAFIMTTKQVSNAVEVKDVYIHKIDSVIKIRVDSVTVMMRDTVTIFKDKYIKVDGLANVVADSLKLDTTKFTGREPRHDATISEIEKLKKRIATLEARECNGGMGSGHKCPDGQMCCSEDTYTKILNYEYAWTDSPQEIVHKIILEKEELQLKVDSLSNRINFMLDSLKQN